VRCTTSTCTLGAFLASFLIRYHRVSLAQAGLIVMCVYGLSGTVGVFVGGVAADALYKRRSDGRLLVGTVAIGVCAPLMLVSLLRPAGDVASFALLMGTGVGIMYAYYSTVYPTIHDIVEPSLRGTAMALYFGAMYLAGASLGPLGTGMISDYFTSRAARAAGIATTSVAAMEPFRAIGLHSAMYAIPALASLLALVLLAASRTVREDIDALHRWTVGEHTQV